MKNLSNNFPQLLFAIIIINALVDISFVIEDKVIQYYIGIGRAIFLTLIIIYIYRKTRINTFLKFPFVTLFLIYSLFLILFSSNLETSIDGYSKQFFSLLFVSISYTLINSEEDLRILIKSSPYIIFIYTINIILSNYFYLGGGVYEKGLASFYSGALTSDTLYTASMATLLVGAVNTKLKNRVQKIVLFLITIALFIFLLLALRRTAIFAILFGYVVFLILQKFNIKYLIIFLFGVIILYISFPLYEDIFFTRIESRQEKFAQGAIYQEMRYIETELVWEKILSFENINESFFGKEIYNSPFNFGLNYGRALHIDYNQIVHGTGLIGLFLYFGIYLSILKIAFNIRKKVKSKNDIILINSLISIIMSVILISFSSGLMALTYRSYAFIIIGGILGYFKILNRNYNKSL